MYTKIIDCSYSYCFIAGLNQNTVIGAVVGALGFLVLILILVCAMLLAIAAKPKRKMSFHVQSQSREEHSTTQLCMTSSSSLSHYNGAAAVVVALRAMNTDEDTSQKRWTASDNVYDNCTADSYVPVASILEAKWMQRGEHLHSEDGTMEAYEEMNGPNSDTAWSQRDEHLYSLDETSEKYEDMDVSLSMAMPRAIMLAQGGKGLFGLDEGWDEGSVFDDDTLNEIEELYDDTVVAMKLNGQPANQPEGQPGHVMFANMAMWKNSAAVAITDSIQGYYDECSGVYDDIIDVDEIYEKIDDMVSNKQPDEYPDTYGEREGGQVRKTEGQSLKQPAKESMKATKQQAKSSVGQPLEQQVKPPIKPSSKPLLKQSAKLLVGQPRKRSLLKPANLWVKQAAKQTDEPSDGQQTKHPAKHPDGPSNVLPLPSSKLPTGYQALCPPHAIAGFHNQYTKLHCKPRHRAQTLGRLPSRQYSSMRETSRRTDAIEEARPPLHHYSEPIHITSAGEISRPVSRQYSSMRKPSQSTDESIVTRPPPQQDAKVTEPSQSSSEEGVLQSIYYI